MIGWKKASAQPPASASRGLSWHQIEMPGGGKADAPSLGCCETLPYMFVYNNHLCQTCVPIEIQGEGKRSISLNAVRAFSIYFCLNG